MPRPAIRESDAEKPSTPKTRFLITRYNPDHPYYMAMYDLGDFG